MYSGHGRESWVASWATREGKDSLGLGVLDAVLEGVPGVEVLMMVGVVVVVVVVGRPDVGLGFLMPPTSVASEGQVPMDLKCATAWLAASWRAAFLEECSEAREPKGSEWPSILMRQAKRAPD